MTVTLPANILPLHRTTLTIFLPLLTHRLITGTIQAARSVPRLQQTPAFCRNQFTAVPLLFFVHLLQLLAERSLGSGVFFGF